MASAKRKNGLKFVRFMPVLIVIAALFFVVLFKGLELRQKNIAYAARAEVLEAELAAEDARAQEIEDYRAYVNTDEYKREILREKFNYADKNEIVFRFNQK